MHDCLLYCLRLENILIDLDDNKDNNNNNNNNNNNSNNNNNNNNTNTTNNISYYPMYYLEAVYLSISRSIFYTRYLSICLPI
jgi:hypothetical protein